MNVLSSAPPAVLDLSERSREVFRHIVAAYVESGEPRLAHDFGRLGMALSPATIRNVMADLEDAGLLYAPHTSAGRLPTDLGLRLFVHGGALPSRLGAGDRMPANLEQTMDEVPEAQIRWQAAGRGMGGKEEPRILQIGHHISDGRRRQRHAQPARNRARTDGSPLSTWRRRYGGRPRASAR